MDIRMKPKDWRNKWLYMVTKAFVDFQRRRCEKYNVTRQLTSQSNCRIWQPGEATSKASERRVSVFKRLKHNSTN